MEKLTFFQNENFRTGGVETPKNLARNSGLNEKKYLFSNQYKTGQYSALTMVLALKEFVLVCLCSCHAAGPFFILWVLRYMEAL